ncbi:hypothetical protein BDR04DRAFT_1119882 [Suillus decipiens]|nr:hypothetical protein BDR04DRAFT_1119882 [Suillus decipiens]
MPHAHHQHAHRSACLKVNTPSYLGVMDEESNNQAHLTPNIPLEQSGPWLTIQWHNDCTLTDMLVNYLTTHPTDCRILFYSDGKKAMAAADDGPSGSDKGQIYGVLVKLIFTDHVNLRSKYKKIKGSFSSTDAGVMPAEGTSTKNLLDAMLLELPWYMELNAIWHLNPSMAMKVHSSRPGIDHTSTFYSLIQLHGGPFPSHREEVITAIITLSSSLPSSAICHAIKDSSIHLQQSFSIRHAEAIESWGTAQNCTSDIAQHIHILINDMQHHFVIRVPHVPNTPDIALK